MSRLQAFKLMIKLSLCTTVTVLPAGDCSWWCGPEQDGRPLTHQECGDFQGGWPHLKWQDCFGQLPGQYPQRHVLELYRGEGGQDGNRHVSRPVPNC